ncbi:MAG: hypothetical protein PVJ67_04030, partial [Candidatus Pacearchaeota archaeon]|jgi:RAB protein geranylgeranyltransferase component A
MVGEIISEYILTDKINPLIINKSVDRIMDNINRWEKSDEEIYDNENTDKDMEEELRNKLNPMKQ